MVSVNCALCGMHLKKEETGKYRMILDGMDVLICERCGRRKEALKEKLSGASPSQIKMLKANKADAPLIDAILKEQQGFTGERPPETVKYLRKPKIEKCKPGYYYDEKAGKCLKLPEKGPEELAGALQEQQMTEEECVIKGGIWDPETGICKLPERYRRE